MTRIGIVVTSVLVLAPAFASEPGQPLDCSDWVFLEPGYSCQMITSSGNPPNIAAGSGSQFDNQGRLFRVTRSLTGNGNCGRDTYRTQIEWLHDGTWHVLAYIDDRCVRGGGSPPGADATDAIYPWAGLGNVHLVLTFDAQNGRMVLALVSDCSGGLDCSAYPVGTGLYWLAAVHGFATTFDVLQTFAPSPSSLAFRVPYMPEGMGGADHFDTYSGNLTNPIDFTQAQPLQCNYPASPPQVGDYLTVADTLPNLPAGQGRYYITAATYQGQTRYGRKATNGRLSGRDPSLLPACIQPSAD